MCKESYLGEFKSEAEKALARTNLEVYSKTISDLENTETIDTEHILEAIQYRNLDRNI